MRYLSAFSGIEAASAAWLSLGWTPAAFMEVEPFPAAVLAHHHPDVPNLGDVRGVDEATIRSLGGIDLMVFGWPCQDLSVAGKRAGLAGARSGLFHEATRILRLAAEHAGCRWFVAENVPGLLSSGGGRDLGEVIRGLTGLTIPVPRAGWRNGGVVARNDGGWSLAWRVLDARFFGVPQRRRRVFLVGHPGADWRHPCQVLFERESLSGDSSTGHKAGTDAARTAGGGLAFGGNNTVGSIDVATTLSAHGGTHGRLDFESETFVTHGSRVRRLTVLEAERLMGFPDGHTGIIYRGKPAADGPRYRALGNSMAVPCMRWIGRRIDMVESMSAGDHGGREP